MTELRLWQHNGKGHYLGACYWCLAHTEEEAAQLIRAAMDNGGLKNEPLNLSWHRADVPGVFHHDNGDY